MTDSIYPVFTVKLYRGKVAEWTSSYSDKPVPVKRVQTAYGMEYVRCEPDEAEMWYVTAEMYAKLPRATVQQLKDAGIDRRFWSEHPTSAFDDAAELKRLGEQMEQGQKELREYGDKLSGWFHRPRDVVQNPQTLADRDEAV